VDTPWRQHATSSLGVDFGGTTADGSVTLDEVFCLGNCALGPTVTVGGQLRGRVQAAELDRLIRDSTMSNDRLSSAHVSSSDVGGESA